MRKKLSKEYYKAIYEYRKANNLLKPMTDDNVKDKIESFIKYYENLYEGNTRDGNPF